MDLPEFKEKVSDLDARMKNNLLLYKKIQKDVADLEQEFCSCGFLAEWLERGKRESIEELFNFLTAKANGRE